MEEWQRELADVLSWNHHVRLRDAFNAASLRSHEDRLAFVVRKIGKCFVHPFCSPMKNLEGRRTCINGAQRRKPTFFPVPIVSCMAVPSLFLFPRLPYVNTGLSRSSGSQPPLPLPPPPCCKHPRKLRGILAPSSRARRLDEPGGVASLKGIGSGSNRPSAPLKRDL
eukprot:scaffold544_cov320-Pavlova_lutheri.AAC.15